MNDSIESERHFHDELHRHGATRSSTARFYTITKASKDRYLHLAMEDCGDLEILEYGCGPGNRSLTLAAAGARVTGIDISSEAIAKAKRAAERRGLGSARFLVMDGHALEFEDGSFDRIHGSGVLHHLELDRALPEVARVLRDDGKAIFFEPLGHNPMINWYRNRTPGLRTPDEHPLLMADWERFETFFGVVETEFFHLTTLMAVPLRERPSFGRWLDRMNAVDDAIFRALPWMRRFAWVTVLSLSQPRSPAAG